MRLYFRKTAGWVFSSIRVGVTFAQPQTLCKWKGMPESNKFLLGKIGSGPPGQWCSLHLSLEVLGVLIELIPSRGLPC